MVKIVFAFVGAQEAALVVVDAQIIVECCSLAHDGKIILANLDAAAGNCGKAAGNLERIRGVVAPKGGVEKELVLQHVLVFSSVDVCGGILVQRILVLKRLDNADLAREPAALEREDGTGVGEHHVVLALEAFGQVGLFAAGESALDVGVGGVRPDLVEREPVGDVVRELLKAERGVVNKCIDGFAVEEIALFEQGEGRVEVVERDVGLDAVRSAALEEVMVVLDALGIDLAGSGGEDAAPGDGEADAVHAKALAKLKVARVLVVEVACGVGGEAALLLEEVVPSDLSFAVRLGFALDLIGCRGASEYKVGGELIGAHDVILFLA